MAKTLQFRRGTSAELDAITGANGEIFIDLDDKSIRIHDGVTQGGFPLATSADVDTAYSNAVSYTDTELTNLNLGTISTQDSDNVSVTGGSITVDSLVASNITYPSTDGTNGQVLATDGSGTLSFIDAGGGEVADGGTGVSTLNAGEVLVGNGTNPVNTISRNGIDTRSYFPNEAILSGDSFDTSIKTTEHDRAAIACRDCRPSQFLTAAIASDNCYLGAARAVALASDDCTTLRFNDAVIATDEAIVSGDNSVILASRRVSSTADGYRLVMGFAASGSANTSNRTIDLNGQDGDISISGSLTQGANFSDFAEMMPNGTENEIEPGVLLTLDNGGVRPATENEEICGVVSYTASILAGDTPFCWKGRYLYDEFGRRLYEDILDPNWKEEIPDPNWNGEGERPMIPNPEQQQIKSIPKQNPEWNPELEQIPRSNRPREWTPVGLIGQVYVRMGEQVQSGDRIMAKNGLGYKTTERTGVKVITVTKDYDGDYGIARCLINVMV